MTPASNGAPHLRLPSALDERVRMPLATKELPLVVARVVRVSLARFFRERAPEAAASIGFYAVFALFPVLLLLVAGSGYLLESEQAQDVVLRAVARLLPAESEFVNQNMLRILEARGRVGVVGLIGLLWAATGVFTVLVRNLNRAWPRARLRNILRARLVALGIVVSLVGLAILFLLAKTVVCVPETWRVPQALAEILTRICRLPSRAVLSIFLFGTLAMLYRFVPSTAVRWREAAVGALFSLGAFRAVTAAFTVYLNSSLARYNVVYGSIGALLALLSWIYVLSLIVLYGSHLAAGVAGVTRGGGAPARGSPGGESDSDDLARYDADERAGGEANGLTRGDAEAEEEPRLGGAGQQGGTT